jgi:hypothetical protein
MRTVALTHSFTLLDENLSESDDFRINKLFWGHSSQPLAVLGQMALTGKPHLPCNARDRQIC